MAIELYGILQNVGEKIPYNKEDNEKLMEMYNVHKSEFSEEIYTKIKPHSVKGGVKIFKGVAPASVLAKYSESDPNYQREIVPEHKKELETYITTFQKDDSDSIYLPEVTLLYLVDSSIDPKEYPLSFIKEHAIKKDNLNLISTLYAIGIHKLNLEIKDNKKPLYRLDGNHRLSLFEEKIEIQGKGRSRKEVVVSNGINDRMISYSIIIVDQDKDTEHYREHLYFYLLNSKALPIHSTHSLSLLDDKYSNILGNFIKNDPFLHIMYETKNSWIELSDTEKNIFIKVVKELQAEPLDVKKIITYCIEGIGMYNRYCESSNPDYLGVCCFIKYISNNSEITSTEPKTMLTEFGEWVKDFSYDISKFSTFRDLYNSFNNYYKKRQETNYIFVAMQFESKYKKIYETAIDRAIDNISSVNKHVKLELMPIMDPNDGENIINNIMDRDILKCHIFIADFSTNNGNVLLEYGYARGHERFMCLLYSKDWREQTLAELNSGNANISITNLIDDFNKQHFLKCKTDEYSELKEIWNFMNSQEYSKARDLIEKLFSDYSEKEVLEEFKSKFSEIEKSHDVTAIRKFHDDLSLKIFDLRMIKDSMWSNEEELVNLLAKRFAQFLTEKGIA